MLVVAVCWADWDRVRTGWLPGHLSAAMNTIFPEEHAHSWLQYWDMDALQQFNYTYTLNYSALRLNHDDCLRSQGSVGIKWKISPPTALFPLKLLITLSMIFAASYNARVRTWTWNRSTDLRNQDAFRALLDLKGMTPNLVQHAVALKEGQVK